MAPLLPVTDESFSFTDKETKARIAEAARAAEAAAAAVGSEQAIDIDGDSEPDVISVEPAHQLPPGYDASAYQQQYNQQNGAFAPPMQPMVQQGYGQPHMYPYQKPQAVQYGQLHNDPRMDSAIRQVKKERADAQRRREQWCDFLNRCKLLILGFMLIVGVVVAVLVTVVESYKFYETPRKSKEYSSQTQIN